MCRNHSIHRTKLASLLPILVFCSHCMASTSSSYDRIWWNATDTDQRTEFLAGYSDCAIYDFGESDLSNARWTVIERKITQYYSTHPEAKEAAAALLVRFGSNRPRSTDLAREVYPGPHGIFDGDYWWQLSDSGRTGFVQGYLACYESGPHGHGLHDHPVEWYVDKVSAFYCFAGTTCTDEHVSEDERVPEKIAIVLQRLGGR